MHNAEFATAIRKGDDRTVRYLLVKDDIPLDEAIHIAAVLGGERIIRILLCFGAKVDALNKNKRTPLINAIEDRRVEIVKLLLENKANVNHEDNLGFTPLLQALVTNKLEIISMLIDYGADINQRNKLGYNVISAIEDVTKPEIIKLLVSKVKIVNGGPENSPLMFPQILRYVEAVKILIDRGASCGVKYSTPLIIACHNQYADTVRLLSSYGATINEWYRLDDNALVTLRNNNGYHRHVLATNRILAQYSKELLLCNIGRH